MEEQGVIAVVDTLEAKQRAFVDFYFSRDCKMEEKRFCMVENKSINVAITIIIM